MAGSFDPRYTKEVRIIVPPSVIYSDISWVILCFGAVFDTIRGSFSFNRYTADIVRYTHGFGWSYRVVQSIQIIIVLLSLTLCSLRYVANS